MSGRAVSRRLLQAAVLAAVATVALSSLTLYDFWWYLKSGELILQGRTVPATDPFSYTAEGRPWINHMWATQVLFALLWEWLGRGSLLVLKAAVVTGAFAIVLATMRRRGVRPLPAAALTLLAAWAGWPFWHVRPQIFTYLALAACLFVLRRGWEHRPRQLALVPLLMVAWVNLHAGFVTGLALVPLVGLATALPPLLDPARRGEGRRVLRLTLVLGSVTGLATLLNPFGLDAVRFPLQVVGTEAFTAQTLEWFSPNFHNPAHRGFELMLLLLVPACVWARRCLSLADLVLLGTFAHLALLSVRHIPLFALVAAAPLAEALQAMAGDLRARRDRDAPAIRRLRAALPTLWPLATSPSVHVTAAALGLVGGVATYWAVFLGAPANPLRLDLNESRYPARTMTFIRTERLPGPLFNLYAWGGYELWRLHPEYRVFIDGRTHVYGAGLLADYLEVAGVRPRWAEVLDRWRVQTVVTPSRSLLAEVLRAGAGWRLVFEEREAAVFVRDDDAHRDLLARLARDSGRERRPEG